MEINKYLTPAAHRMLKQMRDEDEHIIAEGLAVWVGLTQYHRKTLNDLLRLCLIKPDSIDRKPEIYWLNEEGEKIIDDSEYTPLIVAAFRNS